MSTTIEHRVEIDAPPEEVWSVLVDPDRGWDPFLLRLDGELAVGARVAVRVRPAGRRPMAFRPVVLEAEEGRVLRWRGTLGVRGVLDGEHSFTLAPLPGGRTELVQSERFSGVLLPALRGTLRATGQGFALMDEALAREVVRRRGRPGCAGAGPA